MSDNNLAESYDDVHVPDFQGDDFTVVVGNEECITKMRTGKSEDLVNDQL